MIYVLHLDKQFDFIWHPSILFAELQKQGCVLVSESDFAAGKVKLTKNDVLLAWPCFIDQYNTEHMFSGCYDIAKQSGCKVVVLLGDESKRDGVLFGEHAELCRSFGAKRVILTLANNHNIEHMMRQGFTVSTFEYVLPQRERKEKQFDILLSCQHDIDYYPTRTRIIRMLMSETHDYKLLCTNNLPGMYKSIAIHPFHSDRFFELCDASKLGVTCKAGWRDRMVGKYAEFGACWCLPLGDIPSEMHQDMARAMASVRDGDFSFGDLKLVIDNALETYEQRINDYVNCMQRWPLHERVSHLLDCVDLTRMMEDL